MPMLQADLCSGIKQTRAYRLMSLVGSISLAAIAAIGVYYSPVLIGKEFPYVFAFLLVPGVVVALYKSRKHA